MRIIKEAVIGEYHFILDPEYFAITLDKDEKVLISREELSDLVGWLNTEVSVPVKIPWQLVEDRPILRDRFAVTQDDGPGPKPLTSHKEVMIDRVNDEMSKRSATQTVPLHLGDPNLAYTRTAGVKAVETVDLVREASLAGDVSIHTHS